MYTPERSSILWEIALQKLSVNLKLMLPFKASFRSDESLKSDTYKDFISLTIELLLCAFIFSNYA